MLVIPAAYLMSQTIGNGGLGFFMETDQPVAIEEHLQSGLLVISHGTAILLLFVYAAYLFFRLKTHAHLHTTGEGEAEEEELRMSPLAAGTALLGATVATAFAADYREQTAFPTPLLIFTLTAVRSRRFYRGDCRAV